MPLQSSGQITTTDIANEFGYSRGSTNGIRIGDYRGQGFTNPNNTTVRIPTSENVTNDPNGSVRFSDFYGGRLTLVVNYFSAAAEIKPDDAYTRFDSQVQKTVVGNDAGGFKQFTSDDTKGKRVVILVNEDIGSDKNADTSCALRTGTGWNSDTVMQILIGPDGEILGAGGNGGEAGGAWYSVPPSGGGAGSSGLGVQFEGVGGTKVTIQSGGRITGGGGGGGGGGGAMLEDEERRGGEQARMNGGFGGGGAGLPAGTFSTGNASGSKDAGGNGTPESFVVRRVNPDGSIEYWPKATGENNQANGGTGGTGGNLAAAGASGGSGFYVKLPGGGRGIENWPQYFGGGAGGGAAGAAMRRISGMNSIIITNEGPPSQILGDTNATGIT